MVLFQQNLFAFVVEILNLVWANALRLSHPIYRNGKYRAIVYPFECSGRPNDELYSVVHFGWVIECFY